jgi:hypothetical protein
MSNMPHPSPKVFFTGLADLFDVVSHHQQHEEFMSASFHHPPPLKVPHFDLV